jgi:ABC-2 type transport system ATP-binding protein
MKILAHIDGINTVNIKDDLIQIECSRDLTADVAKAIVESGAGLDYLNKKEYGLNDIYYRYFEGGENHE